MIHPAQQLAEFVACVFEPADIVEVRRVPSKRSTWTAAGELADQADSLTADNGRGENIYCGPNPRTASGGRSAADVALARCLFVDFDGDGMTADAATARIDAAGLPAATLLIESGHGVHAYWRLAEPIQDLAAWTQAQRRLIAAVQSDKSIHDAPRIMRLPGFLNVKSEPHVVCQVVQADPSRVYPLDTLMAVLPEVEAPKPKAGDLLPVVSSELSTVARAAAYIDRIERSTVGDRNAIAFRVAAVLQNDFALPASDAAALLAKWNQGNIPPLDDKELADVLSHAAKYASGAPGGKLAERQESLLPNWEKPIDPPQVEAREPFPVEALPSPIREYIVQAAGAIGCDTSAVALPLFSALAAAIGNTRTIELKPGYCEPCILWTALLARSGEQKSPAHKAGVRFLRDKEQAAFTKFREQLTEHQQSMVKYKAKLMQWKRKQEGEPPAAPVEPIAERFIVGDITIEALADRLQYADRGLLLERDELSGWFASFNQYKSGGRGSDANQWIEAYGGNEIRIDRKGGDTKTIYVKRGSVSICGTIQPDILRKALGKEHFANGLAARFLLSFPEKRKRVWSEAVVDRELVKEVANTFDCLLSLSFVQDGEGEMQPIPLMMTDAAKALYVAFYDPHWQTWYDLTQDDDAALWSKLASAGPRLSLLIHCVRAASGDESLASAWQVDEQSIHAGLTLIKWFGAEGRRIYAEMRHAADLEREAAIPSVGSPEATQRDEDELGELLAYIVKRGGSATVRDVARGPRRYRNAIDLAEADLSRLVDSGRGRWEAGLIRRFVTTAGDTNVLSA